MKRVLLTLALLAGAAHAQVVLEVPAAACTPSAAAAASLPAGTYQCRAPLPVAVAVTVQTSAPPSLPPVVTPPSTVTPLPMLGSSGARAEAPSDADSTGYGTKALTSSSVPPLANITPISRGGVTRFAGVTVDGLPAILHRIRQGDPLRNSGARAELSYSGFNFANGEDVWFAAAYKFDTDFDPAKGGGQSDRLLIQQTHQDATSPSPIGNPFSLTYIAGGASQGLNWIVTYQGNDYELYRTPLVIGQWMRLITHYRSGFAAQGDAPIMEAWVAYGVGEFKKLPIASWSATQQFGDPLSKRGTGNDWPKIGMYKWTTGAWGSSPTRTMYSSGLYAGKGANLFDAAAAAVAAYAK